MFKIDKQGPVAVLSLQHGKANAMDVAFCDGLSEQFQALAEDPGVGAVVVTGQGRIFSAGVDLLSILDGGAEYAHRFLPALRRLLTAAFAFPKPMVAAVNGAAIAGGCVLACAADRVLAVEQARLGVPELLVGVPFPTSALEIMRHAVSSRYLHEVLYGGETYGVADAQARGMVHRIVDREALAEQALAEATRLAQLPAAAFALTKQQLRGGAIRHIEDEGTRMDGEAAAQWADASTHELIRGYVERTFKPAR